MNVNFSRTLLLALVPATLLGLAGCGGESPETESGPMIVPRFAYAAQDSALLGAPLTGERHRLGVAATGQKLDDNSGNWAVDYTWFYLMQEPVLLMTMAEMDSLAKGGGITDSTEVGIATYRMRVPAVDLVEAEKVAERMRPPRPPENLRNAARPRPSPAMQLTP